MSATGKIELELAGAGAGWTDVTNDVVETAIGVTRGFQTSRLDDLIAAPPTLSFGLDNSIHNSGSTVGYYSPDSTAKRSGFAVGIGVRYTVTVNSVAHRRFVGWIDIIKVQEGKYEDHSVSVSCLGWIQEANLAAYYGISAQANKRDDQLITTLIGVVPRQPVATSFGVGTENYPYALDDMNPNTNFIGDGLVNVTRSGFSRLYEKADGTLVMETRALRQTLSSDAIVLNDTPPGPTQPGLALIKSPAERRRDQVINHVLCTVHPRKTDAAAVVLYSLPVSTPTMIPAGAMVVFSGNYVDPNQTGQQIGGFDTLISNGFGGSQIGGSGSLPSGDFQFGTAPGLTDATGSVSVGVDYTSVNVTFTVQNLAVNVPCYVTLLQCRGKGIYNYQPVTAQVTDGPSQAQHGRRGVSFDLPYNGDQNFAQSVVEYVLNTRKDSKTILDLGVTMFVHANDEVSMDTLLALEISSPIGIAETVTGLGTSLSDPGKGHYWINGIQESYDFRSNLTLTFILTRREATAWAWGIAGRSEWGQTTVYGL